jgi:hypothetical protein
MKPSMFLRLITHESDTLLPETVGLGDISDVEDSSNKWYEGEELCALHKIPEHVPLLARLGGIYPIARWTPVFVKKRLADLGGRLHCIMHANVATNVPNLA